MYIKYISPTSMNLTINMDYSIILNYVGHLYNIKIDMAFI